MSIDSAQTDQTIESILLEKKAITQEQFDNVTREKLRGNQNAEEIIIQNHYTDQTNIVRAKGELLGIPFIDPTTQSISHDVIKMVPEATARKYILIPFAKDETFLSIAMFDPEDMLISQFLQRSTGLKVKPYISTSDKIGRAIEQEYTKSLGEDVTKAVELATETSAMRLKENLGSIDQAEEVIKVSPVAEIVSVLLEYAVKSNASDIHIEPFENGTRIRYRIDGVLQEKFPLPKSIHDSIVARIKILAEMPIDEKRKPLDGKFKVVVGETRTDLRVSTLPTVFGEKVVIRLLKDQKHVFSFPELGLWGKAQQAMDQALKQTTGIVFVTGPTGSGKTVTQATSLSKLNSIKVNIITLEDPVEIAIPGVNQCQINQKAGLTFATGLRSILRQDPNIIMVGEVRDLETGRLAIQAALTGHLVLATLHTNSAAGAIPRLIDMGVENFLIASTLNIALAQRLSRRICPYCREEYEPDDEVKADLKRVLGEKYLHLGLGESPFKEKINTDQEDENWGNEKPAIPEPKKSDDGKPITEIPAGFKLSRGKGCDQCGQTGYKGRIGLYEVMEVNSAIRKLTEEKADEDRLEKAAIENGMISLLQDGYLKVMWGITTIEEVLSITDDQYREY